MAHTLQLFALEAGTTDSHNATYTAANTTCAAQVLTPVAKTKSRRRTPVAQDAVRTTASHSMIDTLAAQSIVVSLAGIYSGLLEETVTPRRALSLIHAQIAVIAAMVPANLPFYGHAMLIIWAVVACYLARK